jgi:energy-coupling factor transporter ATP-binding protein EcfA2
MAQIQQIIVKALSYVLIGSLLPLIGLLIIAYINEKVRRAMLVIMTPLALVAILAFLYFGPRQPQTIDDWNIALGELKNDSQAWLPLLVILAVLLILGFLFGPALRDRWLAGRMRTARRNYLSAMLVWTEPELAGVIALKSRPLPFESAKQLTGHLRITGGPGVGKTTLLRSQFVQLARGALAEEGQPLPVWIDLDEVIPAPEGYEIDHLDALLPVRTPNLRRLLAHEARLKRLVFLVDSSIETYGTSFASFEKSPTPAQHGKSGPGAPAAANRLARMIEVFAPCHFILAMPEGVISGALDYLVEAELHLPLLSEEEIRAASQDAARQMVLGAARAAQEGARAETIQSAAARDAARINAATDAILKSEGVWRTLANRPWILSRLVRFYIHNGRLPEDLRELFRSLLPPGQQPGAEYEAYLTNLAQEVARTGRYWQPLKALRSAPVTALEEARVIRVMAANPRAGRPKAMLGFAHSIMLAYFTALDWQSRRSLKTLSGNMGSLHTDPLLADAVVFFNNIVSDPALLTETLDALIGPADGIESASHMGRYLAAQCLLAMPPASRPTELTEKVATQLVAQAASDEEAQSQAWLLLEPLDPSARLSIYTRAIASMEDVHLEQTLHRIAAHAPADLRSLLWNGDEDTSERVGMVWANSTPRESMALFQELYERGPVERRGLALACLGELPQEAVGEYLTGLFQTETDPVMRVNILRSLHSCGADLPLTLLEVVSNRAEADEVRIYAAELLATSETPDLHSQSVLREIIRASRVTMPERARAFLQRLLEKLRSELPQDINRWEDIVNPYVIGRPVTVPDQFFGREHTLLELRSAVEKCASVLLTGERRIGKTSLLLRMKALLEAEARQKVPVRAAYMDLAGLPPQEFFEATIRAIIEGLHDANLQADSNVVRPYTGVHFARDLTEILNYQQEQQGTNSRLALMLDEADTLATYPPEMHAALRRVFSGAAVQGLSVILAGVDPQSGWKYSDSPCWASYLSLTLPRLAREETIQLITAPVEGVFQFDDEAQEAIWQTTQGHPAEIQALCQRMASLMLARGERAANAGMVQEALEAINSPRSELVHQAENLLGGVIDWLETHPTATTVQVEEQMKQAWNDLQKIFVQQVRKARTNRSQWR